MGMENGELSFSKYKGTLTQRAPLACTPHPTPPGYILLPQIPARKVLSQVLGPQVSAVGLCCLPPPGASPYSWSAPLPRAGGGGLPAPRSDLTSKNRPGRQ